MCRPDPGAPDVRVPIWSANDVGAHSSQRDAKPPDSIGGRVEASFRGWRFRYRLDHVVNADRFGKATEAPLALGVRRILGVPAQSHGSTVRPRDRRGCSTGQTVRVRILVADDDQAVRESLRRSLTFNGYDVVLACDGIEALDVVASSPDLVLLDVNMPGIDVLEVCRRIRASGDEVPVLMLTARVEIGDRVLGLDAGADDYLPKPFALEELLARVRALLRRGRRPPRDADGSDEVSEESRTFADLTVDPATRMVRRGERSITLTRTEFELLWVLIQRPRRVLSRELILDEVWGYDFPTTANSLEVYIGYLRRKTEADGEPRLIHTVRGVGYVLREQE